MTKYRLFVELKIPDTTAITAFHTLERLGFEIKKLKRYDYYEFETNELGFKDKIVKVDILVNANKHKATVLKEDEKISDKKGALITDTGDDCKGILKTLRSLDIKGINSMKKGVYWEFDGDDPEKMVKELLYNEHYQEFELIG